MQKKLFLHIGTEKTGTTALQEYLYLNANRLQAQGFHYPTEWNKAYVDAYAHFPVAAALLDEAADFVHASKLNTLDIALDALALDIAEIPEHVILSAEHFSSRIVTPEPLKKLQAAFSDRKIIIVVYIRRIDAFALSYYSTAVRSGLRRPFSIEEITPEVPYYNHLRMLQLWGSVFGLENVVTRLYDRTTLVNHNICADFCHLLGINDAGFIPNATQNASLDASQLETLRFINQVWPEFEESPEAWRNAAELRNAIVEHLPQGQSLQSLLTPADREVLRKKFHPINIEIEKQFLFTEALTCNKKTTAAPQPAFSMDDQTLQNNLRTCLIGLAAKVVDLQKQNYELANAVLAIPETPPLPFLRRGKQLLHNFCHRIFRGVSHKIRGKRGLI